MTSALFARLTLPSGPPGNTTASKVQSKLAFRVLSATIEMA